jgi:hypothetical protein
MVSAIMLAFICSRLDEIFPNRKTPFSNINVIFFGDLLQVINILK